MNLSLDANDPFTIYIYKCCPYPVFSCITEFSDFQYYITGAILTPRYQKTARSRSSLSIPEHPFLLLIYKWSWLFPWALKSHDRSFWQKSPQVFVTVTPFSPPHGFLREKEREHSQRSDKARHNMKNSQECKLLLTSAFHNSPVLYF